MTLALSDAERKAASRERQRLQAEKYAEADRVGKILAMDEAKKIAAYRRQRGAEPETKQELEARVLRAQGYWRWRVDEGMPVGLYA